MVVGTGLDVVDVGAFQEILDAPGTHFTVETFTDEERNYSTTAISRNPTQHLAVRYAAKEAALKALDQACSLHGNVPPHVPLRALEVRRDDRGRPSLWFHEEAETLAQELRIDRTWLSLSHDGPIAAATVILERIA